MKTCNFFKITWCIAVIFLMCIWNGISQGVAIGTPTADASAQLDVAGTTKGFLLPRITTAQRDAIVNPATGLMIFNTSDRVFNYYNGVNWVPLETATISQAVDGGAWFDGSWLLNGSSAYNLGGGNVGIGTSSPAAKLEIGGSTRLNTMMFTTGAMAGRVLTSDSAGNASWTTSASAETDPTIGVLSSGDIPKWSGSQMVPGALVQVANRVGIGTNTPGGEFEIVGSGGYRHDVANLWTGAALDRPQAKIGVKGGKLVALGVYNNTRPAVAAISSSNAWDTLVICPASYATFGMNGTSVSGIIRDTILTPAIEPIIAANSTTAITFSLPGAVAGANALVSIAGDIGTKLILGSVRTVQNGQLEISFANLTNLAEKLPGNLELIVTVFNK